MMWVAPVATVLRRLLQAFCIESVAWYQWFRRQQQCGVGRAGVDTVCKQAEAQRLAERWLNIVWYAGYEHFNFWLLAPCSSLARSLPWSLKCDCGGLDRESGHWRCVYSGHGRGSGSGVFKGEKKQRHLTASLKVYLSGC